MVFRSNHDSYVFQKFDWYRQSTLDRQSRLSSSGDYHILSDNDFPVQPWLLAPFKKTEQNINRTKKL